MQMKSTTPLLLCGFGICLLLLGCGTDEGAYDGPKRIPVSGKVTFDGQPVDGGTITFLPKQEGIRPTGGQILNGEYNVPEEKGGNEGTYLVQINWRQPTGKQVQDADTGEMVDVLQETIPKKYHEESSLDVKLSPENNVHNFDLTSK
jgi:hypothetical protein